MSSLSFVRHREAICFKHLVVDGYRHQRPLNQPRGAGCGCGRVTGSDLVSVTGRDCAGLKRSLEVALTPVKWSERLATILDLATSRRLPMPKGIDGRLQTLNGLHPTYRSHV